MWDLRRPLCLALPPFRASETPSAALPNPFTCSPTEISRSDEFVSSKKLPAKDRLTCRWRLSVCSAACWTVRALSSNEAALLLLHHLSQSRLPSQAYAVLRSYSPRYLAPAAVCGQSANQGNKWYLCQGLGGAATLEVPGSDITEPAWRHMAKRPGRPMLA